MIGAVIDLGTNTFNLLVFEKKAGVFKTLHIDRSFVGLGLEGINENRIADKAFKRGVEAILIFKEICRKYGVEQIKAFGTSALRGAKNTSEFCEAIKSRTAINVEVISGEREAELIYKGVAGVHEFKKDACIMDIGGGSTEFIMVKSGVLSSMNSFDIGISRIFQSLNLSDPLSTDDKQKIDQFLTATTKSFFTHNKSHEIVGASGSFDTFYELIFSAELTALPQSSHLPFDQLMQTLDILIESSYTDRLANDYILDLRKNMIHVAAFKTKWVIEKLGIQEAWVSPASLKEGVMSEM